MRGPDHSTGGVPRTGARTTKKANGAPIRAIDLFCGAGGSSWGAKQAGAEIVAAFDMWALAGKNHHENFPEAKFYEGKLETINPDKLAEELGKIDLILASPECTNHSPAKGKAERCEISKNTAFEVLRFAKALKPRWIVIENVINMMKWGRYKEFYDALEAEGYKITPQKLNAADFGVPQSRRRLFLLCDRQRTPSPVTKPKGKRVAASSFVKMDSTYKWSPVDNGRRAEATLERAKRGRQHLKRNPFLMVYYGSDGSGGWQRLNKPLRTVTTVDRFAVVRREGGKDVMRMLQPEELTVAMGMQGMKFLHGSRREKIHMLGNAVCPPIMTEVVQQLTGIQHDG